MEYVIFVHGTFAGSEEDNGDKWWQKGSEFAQALEQRLPDTITCMGLSPVFHWSGANSYGERRRAALKLLTYVSELERKQQPYHFVAHSHGGGVVWDALALSESPEIRKLLHVMDFNRPTLQSLKSVTTVGTPFLTWREGRLATLTKYFAFFYMFMLVMMVMFGTLWVAYTAFQGSDRLLDELVWQQGLNTDLHFFSYVLTTIAVVLWLAVLSLLISPLFTWWTATALQEERDFEYIAASRYGSRCLFLFSDQDEAIQSLRAALHLKAPLIANLRGRYLSPFDSLSQKAVAKLRFAAVVAFAPVRWMIRNWLAPLGDNLIFSVLRGNTYGADREGASVAEVNVTPPHLPDSIAPLPQETTDALLSISRQGIDSALPQIRSGLGQLAAASPESLISGAIQLDDTGIPALIHTAYFSCSDITDLIDAHIRQQRTDPVEPTLQGYLADYFNRLIEQRNLATVPLAAQIEQRIKEVRRANMKRALLWALIQVFGFAALFLVLSF